MFQEMMKVEVKEQESSSTSRDQERAKRGMLGEIVRHGGLVREDVERSIQESKRDPTNATLSEEEVQGNVFVLALGGSRTTSDTIHHALILLAVHPDIQEWVIQDIDRALASEESNPLKWHYQTLFPKLIAPLCVMVCFISSKRE